MLAVHRSDQLAAVDFGGCQHGDGNSGGEQILCGRCKRHSFCRQEGASEDVIDLDLHFGQIVVHKKLHVFAIGLLRNVTDRPRFSSFAAASFKSL